MMLILPHTVSIFFLSWMKISGELNQCADSEMPLSRAAGNAPERLGDLLRGKAEAKSPTLIRKSCAGSWVQQRALNLWAVSLRLLQHPRLDVEGRSVRTSARPTSLSHCVFMCLNTYMSITDLICVWCVSSRFFYFTFLGVSTCLCMCVWSVSACICASWNLGLYTRLCWGQICNIWPQFWFKAFSTDYEETVLLTLC